MPNHNQPPKRESAIDAERQASLARGFVWALPFGVCGFLVPFAVLGIERILRMLLTDVEPSELNVELYMLATNGAASAVVCSLIFASAAVASFSPPRGIGYVRSLIAMAGYAIVAMIAAVAIWIFLCPFDRGNPKTAKDFFVWFYLTYQYLLVFPATFIPGVAAFTWWQIARDADITTPSQSATLEQRNRPKCTLVELLVCVTLVLAWIVFLRPVFSQSRAQLLAEGDILWHGQPVNGATVEFYPVLKSGHLGQPVHQDTPPDGHFCVYTFPEWRKTNSTTGEFAVTVSLPPDKPNPIPGQKLDAIKVFASPQTTPIRVTIAKRKRNETRIELSEWCSLRER
ncbi:MAG: hypothetical protein ABFC88_02645 [Thermoguttaceae bacterium]